MKLTEKFRRLRALEEELGYAPPAAAAKLAKKIAALREKISSRLPQ